MVYVLPLQEFNLSVYNDHTFKWSKEDIECQVAIFITTAALLIIFSTGLNFFQTLTSYQSRKNLIITLKEASRT